MYRKGNRRGTDNKRQERYDCFLADTVNDTGDRKRPLDRSVGAKRTALGTEGERGRKSVRSMKNNAKNWLTNHHEARRWKLQGTPAEGGGGGRG